MAGESLGGVLVSISRIATKASLGDGSDGLEDDDRPDHAPGKDGVDAATRSSTYAYFFVSMAFCALCIVLYEVARRSEFSRAYVAQAESDSAGEKLARPVDTLRLLPLGHNKSDRSGEPAESEGEGDESRVDDASAGDVVGGERTGISRVDIIRRLPRLVAAIFLTYFVTLALFPGVLSQVPSPEWGDWLPIVLISVFNLFDLVGKIVPVWLREWSPRRWTPQRLLQGAVARLLFIPLIMMCARPADTPLLRGEAWSIVLTALLGLTNAYLSTIIMSQGPRCVGASESEVAGGVMALFLMGGLTAGSVFSLGLGNTS